MSSTPSSTRGSGWKGERNDRRPAGGTGRAGRGVLRRIASHPTGRIGLLFAGGVVLLALLAPLLAPHGAEEIVATPLREPSGTYLLGTDELGRDVLSRVIWGSQVSLQVSVLATLIALLAALPLGLTAG
jgi:peptide/nickel transport system permease protein